MGKENELARYLTKLIFMATGTNTQQEISLPDLLTAYTLGNTDLKMFLLLCSVINSPLDPEDHPMEVRRI